MRIDELSIKGFGKFKEKNITFKNGMNVIYGNNESGKSTILSFVKAMLFYMDKSEENKFIPWGQAAFGAINKLTYTIDNNQQYNVEKDFNRRTTSVFMNNPYRDVTALFSQKKGRLIYFEEQTGLNLPVFLSSVFIAQKELKPLNTGIKDLTDVLVRLSKYGDQDIDYYNALNKLEQLKDTIGLGNTGKHKKLVYVNQLISSLQDKKEKAFDVLEKLQELQKQLNGLVLKNEQLNDELDKLSNYLNDKKSTIKSQIESCTKKLQFITEVSPVKNSDDMQNQQKVLARRRFYINMASGCAALLIVFSALGFAKMNEIWNWLLLGVPILGWFLWNYNKKILKNMHELKFDDNNDVAEKNREIFELKRILQELIDEDKGLEDTESRIKSKEMVLKQNEVMIGSINKEMDMLSKEYSHPGDIEEELDILLKEKEDYENTLQAISIAKDFLGQSLVEVQQNYTPKLNRKMSEIMCEITSGRHQKLDTGVNLNVFIGDDDFGNKSTDYLSSGTLDQVYLSLRLAIAQILSGKEKLPLIIDEGFAQFDDKRLENSLRYLSKVSKSHQMILCACQEREVQRLDKLMIKYNFIGL